MVKIEFSNWLDQNLSSFGSLRTVLLPLVESILAKEGVEYLNVTGRLKDKSSALDKMNRKNYGNAPEDMTDLCGIRIITFLNDQVEQIEKILRSSFDIDEKNSSNRSAILSQDKVGYRSIHLVATLGHNRSQLPEYKNLHLLKFEVQIRTVLQHAWAELAHDRSFKFGTALPDTIQRKLNLHSGLLELADNAFAEIAKEVESYRINIKDQPLGKLFEERINDISVSKYLEQIARKEGLNIQFSPIGVDVISELKDFGMLSIKDIHEHVTESFIKEQKNLNQIEDENNYVGFLRDIMMYADVDRYFHLSWKNHWSGLDGSTQNLLHSKYGREKIAAIIKYHDVDDLRHSEHNDDEDPE